MEDDAVAAQLTEQLPSDHILSFDSRMGTAQVAALPQPLDVRGDAMRSYRAGDVVYWSTEQALVIFLTDGFAVPDDGVLTRIGAVVDGMDQLVGCERDCRVHFGATSSSLGRGGG
ncbi:hypothetical protein Bcav_0412 [Beutenbergia cavernae DSM 12333]|uniref:Cyclophilin-like domain-containing protein n=1 Tax=Beutenbergia cavernae (strain ATCC BAA-8 / DSM 12333 / CCUG 43141 / JCM 11478 / NBRC 16432 / NCIMB 13614 / HKI 0122) TaxID=471853 RepID=C5BX01_BEUC1|nr:cyclophilin-like fold protein [Beutenbergia cavernae]ACQ78676.1 hypothetical protein Bcav_0412 [Beutenbergia cavernae DSM 12333]